MEPRKNQQISNLNIFWIQIAFNNLKKDPKWPKKLKLHALAYIIVDRFDVI